MKAIITFPLDYDLDEVYTMEIPDNPCFNEPEPGLKYEAEVQIGYIRNNIKLLYNSIHPDQEVCNVKFDFEIPKPKPPKLEYFELPDHLKTQRLLWGVIHRTIWEQNNRPHYPIVFRTYFTHQILKVVYNGN